jgi:Uma2 family endonuclease
MSKVKGMTLGTRPVDIHKPRRIHYPERDGKPMGETDRHILNIAWAIPALRLHFSVRSDVYVSGNNFIYYEEGNPRARVSPDTYVVFGVSPELRKSYFVWREEGRTPSIVFEYTSRSSRIDDIVAKRELYEKRLKVQEYILFDPDGDYLSPRLQGFRMNGGQYVSIPLAADRLFSETLGLEVFAEGPMIRFFDPATARVLPTLAEESRRAEEESRRAHAAEEEVARLKEELLKLRGGKP